MKKNRENVIDRKQAEKIRDFLKNAEQPDIDEKRKQQTLMLLRMERKRLHLRSKKPYGQRVMEQAAYLSPVVWLIQGALILFMGYEFLVREKEEILINLLFCAPIIGIAGFTEIMRSYRQNMWELEQACRYNLRQLMGMRLLIFGITDSLVTCSVAVMGIGAGIHAWELLFFFFIPQILSDCVYLHLMARFRRRFQGTALISAAVLMTLLWMVLLQDVLCNPEVIKRLADPCASAIILAVSIGLLAMCCMRFLKGTETEYCEA